MPKLLIYAELSPRQRQWVYTGLGGLAMVALLLAVSVVM
jgi:hypothetical protein